MKILNSKVHGIIDYIVVIFLWLSPTLFGLTSPISTLVYALGGVHLLLTVLTDFPYGVVKVVPLKLHGWVELLVAIRAIVISTLSSLICYIRKCNGFIFLGGIWRSCVINLVSD
ncbi:hypothetical protein BH10BAC4_BH10BAC4_20150 [soil metagenome]